MTVRDLGYRAYEGELLPASHNTWVLLRYGIWRIWGPWLNRIAIIGAILPFLGMALIAAFRYLTSGHEIQNPILPTDPVAWLRFLTGVQFWFFVTVVTLRSGASVVAEDFNNRAYRFYFAKPVTPVQYLVGHASALAIVVFVLVFVPSALLTLVLSGTGPEDQVLEHLGLLLPGLLNAVIITVTSSVCALAISTISKSRALTMSAWMLILFVPFVLGFLVKALTQTDWGWTISIPGMLWVISDSLYKAEGTWTELHWYHAAPLLAVLSVGGAFLAHYRIRRAEVIT
jgi:ABC-type transport system involved in multi-copper enzyme maturation permease subunit